jgi:NAD(P)-dependent dehydrogenase (short-subunit alcohol dehydrogenase family)
MKSKIVLITGGAGGIGFEAAVSLARMGASIVISVRNELKGQSSVKKIVELSSNNKVSYLVADLSTILGVRKLAQDFLNQYNRLDVLVNNAAQLTNKKIITSDGTESTIAVNLIAPFLLIKMFSSILKKSTPSRVINVASKVHFKVNHNLDPMQWSDENPVKIYGLSKLGLIMLTYEFARKFENTGVTVNVMCPGGVSSKIWKNNKSLTGYIFGFLYRAICKQPAEGARLVAYLASSSAIESMTGKYFETPTDYRINSTKWDEKNTEKLSHPLTYKKMEVDKMWYMVNNLIHTRPSNLA